MAGESRKHGLWWWIDRYRKSTAYTDMTLAEQGAYRNLLDEQRLRGGLLPNDERILAKVCGDALEWPKVRAAVLARFEPTEDGGHLFNATAKEINAVTDALSATRAEVGRRGFEQVDRGADGQFTGKCTGKPTGKQIDKPRANGRATRTGKTTGSVAVSVAVVRSPLSVAGESSSSSTPGGNGRAAGDEDAYVTAVLQLYCRVPGARDKPTKADRKFAEHLWTDHVPITQVRAGILKATLHREGRARDSPLEPINALAYFGDEIKAAADCDPDYLEHLVSRGEGYLKPETYTPEEAVRLARVHVLGGAT
jgi:uncharacterized protein YdaU (DUF1376 family)